MTHADEVARVAIAPEGASLTYGELAVEAALLDVPDDVLLKSAEHFGLGCFTHVSNFVEK